MAEYKQLGAYEALDRSTMCAMDMSCGVFQISGRFKASGNLWISIACFAKGCWKDFEAQQTQRDCAFCSNAC